MESLFVHPELRKPEHPDYRKAKTISWAIVVLLIAIALYDAYFYFMHPEDTRKNLTNLVGHILFSSNLIVLRLSRNIKYVLVTLIILSLPATMFSIYHTGGIYSTDITWLLLTIVGTYVFVDVFWGIAISALVSIYLGVLFYLEEFTSVYNFKEYINQHNSSHFLFTPIFVIAVLCALLVSFKKALDKANHKIEELSEERITTLEILLKKKTDEISELRNSLARDFHDEMGNKLASITILSQSAQLHIDETKDSQLNSLLTTIQTRSRQLYEGTKDFIWSIDFKSSYAYEWYIYVRDFGESFFSPLGISFLASTELTKESLTRIDNLASRQLVMICKEIMTNAAKHSQASEISFTVLAKNEKLIIIITDDGDGFDVETVSKRGLQNIHNRIDSLKAKLNIHSLKGTGSTFEIQIATERIML